MWIWVQLQSLNFQILHLLWARSSLTFSQMHHKNKYSQHSSIIKKIKKIRPVWLNGWVSVYELSVCEFKSSCSHLNFRFHSCFKQGASWHSGNYRVWIHSETCMWHDKNIQSGYRLLVNWLHGKTCQRFISWKIPSVVGWENFYWFVH